MPDSARLLERIKGILERKWLTNNGPLVQEFEQALSEMLGVRHCIATCNATVGLEIAIRALGLSGEVIVPSFTFVATAHALQWQQITPVFCDVDPKNHNLDPRKVEDLITDRTTGILGVHLWGRPCNVADLDQIARRHNLTLFFDAAHALGCTLGGQNIGSLGYVEIFSFHATKFINSFEGGAIATDSDELATRIRLLINFGFVDFDEVESIGTNGKMSEASAAMGLTGLENRQFIVNANRANYHCYKHNLENMAGIRLLEFDESEENNYQYIVLEIDSELTGLSRDEIQQLLRAEGVIARRYFFPGCHNLEPYRSLRSYPSDSFSSTAKLCEQVLVLPTGTAVDTAEADLICETIGLALKDPPLISKQLSKTQTPTPRNRPVALE